MVTKQDALNILIFICIFFFTNTNAEEKILDNTLGRLIRLETERKVSGASGAETMLREVIFSYYKNIESLSAKDRAMYIFVAQNKLDLHGEGDVFHKYSFIYLCCNEAYKELLSSQKNNPYLDSKEISRRLKILNRYPKILSEEAASRGITISEYKNILIKEFRSVKSIIDY